MPIYEYECPHCGKRFEAFHKMKNASARTPCPDCKRTAKKIITAPALKTDTNFVFTGVHDNRLCDLVNRDDKIEGRKDYERRLEKKGLRELDRAEVENF